MNIKIPELSLILLVGASSAGKSSFAKKHFLGSEVISSDYCRFLVSDEENNMDATKDAFELLHYIVAKRLKRGKLVVVDATNAQADSRKSLLKIAKEYHAISVVITLHMPESLLIKRHEQRTDRPFDKQVIIQQRRQVRQSLKRLKREGFRYIYTLRTPEEVEAVQINREKLWNDKKEIAGPFDIIGDIHGCFDELQKLLKMLGYHIYEVQHEEQTYYDVIPPEGRKAIFLGDLVDRGPKSPQVLRLVMDMIKNNDAYCVPGNHDVKLLRKLSGKNVQIKHGLKETLEQLENCSEEFIEEVKVFLKKLVSHYVLDGGKLVVAHAGLREEMQGRASGTVRSFCLYGETTGEIDSFGLPVRYNWAKEYKGKAMVVYGHTPIPETEWLNNTINIDTGCVFGGALTALQYPEKRVVSVKAAETYCESARPFLLDTNDPETVQKPEIIQLSAQQEVDDLLDIKDVAGKKYIWTHHNRNVIIREEQAITALEAMSRFAINPKWLIYLPPTMSPSATSELPDYLEHPLEAFTYYRKRGLEQVICEEKHMGSRAVIVICKDIKAAQKRFGIQQDRFGICYTRTGRHFFKDTQLESTFLTKLRTALSKVGFWEEFDTDWFCFDCELLPWTAKAKALIEQQYAAVGAAAQHALTDVLPIIDQAKARGLEMDELSQFYQAKASAVEKYRNAYRAYCREVKDINDLKLAPFHILATEGQVHSDKDHLWHMTKIAELAKADPNLLLATPYKIIELRNERSVQEGVDWWLELTAKGGEGMVIKSFDFMSVQGESFWQPAMKCRGKEYLRIIYGVDYDNENNLKRLKKRGLNKKQGLALNEFLLGEEALQRFVKKQPLRLVHECVFGILALESEGVDPRL